jgi:hypothetical protein
MSTRVHVGAALSKIALRADPLRAVAACLRKM